jgi:hypothetical protein
MVTVPAYTHMTIFGLSVRVQSAIPQSIAINE